MKLIKTKQVRKPTLETNKLNGIKNRKSKLYLFHKYLNKDNYLNI